MSLKKTIILLTRKLPEKIEEKLQKKYDIIIPKGITTLEIDYFTDFSIENISFVINQIFECDGTVQRRLEKAGFIDWKIKFDNKNLVGAGFIINLPDLGGEKKLNELGVKCNSLMDF